jgi:lysozyme family protein
MSNPVAWLEDEFFQLLFRVAKHVVTEGEVVSLLTQMVKEYEISLKAANPAPLPVTVLKVPYVKPSISQEYEDKFNNLIVNPGVFEPALNAAKRVLAFKSTYEEISKATNVPWWMVGLIHLRESDLNFGTYLGNGQSLHHRTTIVPVGRGPFDSFADGAIDALKLQHLSGLSDWSIGNVLVRLEVFNGLGYRMKGVPSPYIWAGSNLYKSGKYVADGVYDPNVVDKQIGCAVVLRMLQTLVPLSLSHA